MTGPAGVYTNYRLLSAGHNEVDMWRTKTWTDTIAAARSRLRSYPAVQVQPSAPAPGGRPGGPPPPPPPGSGPGGEGGSGGGSGGPSASGGSSGAGGPSGAPSTGTGSGSGSGGMSYAAAARSRNQGQDRRTQKPSRYHLRSSTLDKTSRSQAQGRVEKPKRPWKYPRPPPRTINGKTLWHVARVVASRISRDGQLQYNVQWTGWPVDRKWHPAEKFKRSPSLLLAFHQSNLGEAGPPARLAEWSAAVARGEAAAAHVDDSKAAIFWWSQFSVPASSNQW